MDKVHELSSNLKSLIKRKIDCEIFSRKIENVCILLNINCEIKQSILLYILFSI